MSSRLFVDVTRFLLPIGSMPLPGWALDRDVAARLLAANAPAAIAVVLKAGRILALSAEQASRILNAAEAAPAPAPAPATPLLAPPPPPRLRAWSACTAALRAVARKGVAALPGAVREDVRAVLVHMRAIVRTLIYGPRVPTVAAPAPLVPPLSSALSPALSPALAQPQPPDAAALMAPWLVVHPTPGDLVWTAGSSGNLRALAEARHRAGFRVAVLWHQPAPPAVTDPSDALVTAMLFGVDLVVTLAEPERARLAACAAGAGLSPTIALAGPEPSPAMIAALVARLRQSA